MVSVIIPAHNEAEVIERCLRELLGDRATQELATDALDVIVVCNGCSDDTAARAARFGSAVRVIQSPEASKSKALNLGDAAAKGFPRFYLDADVLLSRSSVDRVCEALSGEALLGAAPRMEVDLTNRSWPIRAFYQIWLGLPYARSGMIGSGVYALSLAGRERFGEFPDITADDAFVRLHFNANERRVVESCSFQISPPFTLWSLVRIKSRWHDGNAELRRKFPALFENEEADQAAEFIRMARRFQLWPALALYVLVRIAARLYSKGRAFLRRAPRWERDDTARLGTSG